MRTLIAAALCVLAAAGTAAEAAGFRPDRPLPAARAAEGDVLALDLNMRWAGSWVWTKGGRSDNFSTFEIREGGTASYCYDSNCKIVKYTFKDGVLSFSFNGKDYFELIPSDGGKVVYGRYWRDRAQRTSEPAARIRFDQARS